MDRIDKIVNFIDENKVVADIGSDHGITAIKIYEEKNPKKIIATDISKNSLQKLIDKIEYNKYNIETMVTDGIYELSDSVEEIIISGMGGILISHILEKGKCLAKKLDKIILQPNNSQQILRKWLHNNNFSIIDEVTVEEENIIYNIIVSKYTDISEKYEREIDYIYGKINLDRKDKLTIKMIENNINNERKIIEKIKSIKSEKVKNKIKNLEYSIKNMENILCKLKN